MAPCCKAYNFATCPSLPGFGVLRIPYSSEWNCMCMNGLRWVRGCTGPDPPYQHPFPDPVAWWDSWWLGKVLLQWMARPSFDASKGHSALHSTCVHHNKPGFCVTLGNSPTAPGTLGSYEAFDWARLANAGVNKTERSHNYHFIHNIYWDITSSQHMVHGMVKVHNIRQVTCKLHHHRSTTSTVSTASASPSTPLALKK